MSASVHDGTWDLTLTDRPLVEAKRWANRLRFAVMLLFFRARGRFPRAAAEVDGAAVAELARTLGGRAGAVHRQAVAARCCRPHGGAAAR